MPSAAEKNISDIVRMEQEVLRKRSLGERFADLMTSVATKPWFIAAHVILCTIWIAANLLGTGRFDPQPFNLLNTIISIEAIFLTLLVLASQHRMSRLSERRAHLNLQVDLLTEQELTVALRMLERLFQHFELEPVTGARQAAEMRKMTDVEGLVHKIADKIEV